VEKGKISRIKKKKKKEKKRGVQGKDSKGGRRGGGKKTGLNLRPGGKGGKKRVGFQEEQNDGDGNTEGFRRGTRKPAKQLKKNSCGRGDHAGRTGKSITCLQTTQFGERV